MNGLSDRWGDAMLLAAAPDRHTIDGDAAIAPVDKHHLGFLIGENADLLYGFWQRMPVIGNARHAAQTDNKTYLVRGGNRDLNAKFVGLAGLAFGSAFNLRRMQAVELVLVLRFLFEQPFDSCQDITGLGYLVFIFVVELAFDVAPDATYQCAQRFQRGFHAPALPGMGITASLGSQFWGLTVVVLAQRNVERSCQFYQMLPATFEQAAVSRVSHRLFHHGGVNDDFLKALCLDTLPRRAASMVSLSSHSTPSSPMRRRCAFQR